MPEEDKVRAMLKKEESRRKILYAENELKLFKQDSKIRAIKVLFELAKKYNIETEDIEMILEIAPSL